MPQNIYDDPDFFAAYSRLGRSRHGLDGAPEWPDLRELLPPLAGAGVLDLGCGFGWFCRWAAAEGARSVRGVDLSVRMLDRARADTTAPEIVYEQADLDTLELRVDAYDLVQSSLVLHYLDDLARLVRTVRESLRSTGRFVFSVEHPIFSAPARPGFVDLSGRTVWPVDGYLSEGERSTDWLAPGVVKQHRSLATYLNTLLQAGMSIVQVVEWGPSEQQIATHPEWAHERERPAFLLVSAAVA